MEGDLFCPFCGIKLIDYEIENKQEKCCDNVEVINVDGMFVCKICGVVDSYDISQEYIDFYENMFHIRRKSVYHRKYHISNVSNDIYCKHKIQISSKERDKINTFAKIESVLLNDNRKRSIQFNFIFRKLLELLQSDFLKYFELPKKSKTLHQYNKILKDICEKCGLRYIESDWLGSDERAWPTALSTALEIAEAIDLESSSGREYIFASFPALDTLVTCHVHALGLLINLNLTY